MAHPEMQLVLILETQPDLLPKPRLYRDSDADLNRLSLVLSHAQVRKARSNLRERLASNFFAFGVAKFP